MEKTELDVALCQLGDAIIKHGMWTDEWELYVIICGLVEKQKNEKVKPDGVQCN